MCPKICFFAVYFFVGGAFFIQYYFATQLSHTIYIYSYVFNKANTAYLGRGQKQHGVRNIVNHCKASTSQLILPLLSKDFINN